MAQDEVNKIKLERQFADSLWRQFRAEKFGISSCCYSNDQSILLKKYLCDWQDKESKVLIPTTNLIVKTIDCEDK